MSNRLNTDTARVNLGGSGQRNPFKEARAQALPVAVADRYGSGDSSCLDLVRGDEKRVRFCGFNGAGGGNRNSHPPLP